MLFVAALAGCVSSPPGFTPTSPPAETPAPAPTPTVTPTPTPAPTATPTETPTPTPPIIKTPFREINQADSIGQFLEGKTPPQDYLLFGAGRIERLEIGYYEIDDKIENYPEVALVHVAILSAFTNENGESFILVGTANEAGERYVIPVLIGDANASFLNKGYILEQQKGLPSFYDYGTISPDFIDAREIVGRINEQINIGGITTARVQFMTGEYPPGALKDFSGPAQLEEYQRVLFSRLSTNRLLVTNPDKLYQLLQKEGWNPKNPESIIKILNENPSLIPFTFGIFKITTH